MLQLVLIALHHELHAWHHQFSPIGASIRYAHTACRLATVAALHATCQVGMSSRGIIVLHALSHHHPERTRETLQKLKRQRILRQTPLCTSSSLYCAVLQRIASADGGPSRELTLWHRLVLNSATESPQLEDLQEMGSRTEQGVKLVACLRIALYNVVQLLSVTDLHHRLQAWRMLSKAACQHFLLTGIIQKSQRDASLLWNCHAESQSAYASKSPCLPQTLPLILCCVFAYKCAQEGMYGQNQVV